MKNNNLNNKGITLAELIVSIALVAVAAVYFYQTLYTVNKLYKNSSTEVSGYVEKNYSYRLVDAYIESLNGNITENFCSSAQNHNIVGEYFELCELRLDEENNLLYVKFNTNDSPYELLKYIKN